MYQSIKLATARTHRLLLFCCVLVSLCVYCYYIMITLVSVLCVLPSIINATVDRWPNLGKATDKTQMKQTRHPFDKSNIWLFSLCLLDFVRRVALAGGCWCGKGMSSLFPFSISISRHLHKSSTLCGIFWGLFSFSFSHCGSHSFLFLFFYWIHFWLFETFRFGARQE